MRQKTLQDGAQILAHECNDFNGDLKFDLRPYFQGHRSKWLISKYCILLNCLLVLGPYGPFAYKYTQIQDTFPII